MTHIAFVLMPFSEDLEDVYGLFIKPVLEEIGYVVKRADDIVSQRNILADIVQGISAANLIVADLTGANPNVYYELGIAHSLHKNVLLMTQEIDSLPFDLRSYRTISYSTHFSRINDAKEEVRKIAKGAMEGSLPFGNPVKDFLPNIGLSSQIDNRAEQDKNEHEGKNSGEEEEEGELGILDHRITLEEQLSGISQVVTDMGEHLTSLTVEINRATEVATDKTASTRKQRDAVRELARHMQNYGAFLRPKNREYRAMLSDIETSLEYILGGNLEIHSDSDLQEVQQFVGAFASIRPNAEVGRESFITLTHTLASLPKIEQNFDRSKGFVHDELIAFVENVDQTISVIERAKNLGNALVESYTGRT